MSSFISSSSGKAAVVFTLLLGLMLGVHERVISNNLLVGGFMVAVDPDLFDIYEIENILSHDLIIVGSSRAKESVRPSMLAPFLGDGGMAINASCRSCSSQKMTHKIANYLRKNGSGLSAGLLVTVEPWFFTKVRGVMLNPPEGSLSLADGMTTPRRLLARIGRLNDTAWRAANGEIQNVIDRHAPDGLNMLQRRALPYWIKGFSEFFRRLPESFPDVVTPLKESLYFHVIAKSAKSYNVVIYADNGYAGHIVRFADPSATLSERFDAHMPGYRQVLPTYSKEDFAIFRRDLRTLQAAGARIVFLRLPIYKDLYRLEQEIVPQFDADMRALTAELDIPYLNMNEGYRRLTDTPETFTDGSHFNHEATPLFNELLRARLAPYFGPSAKAGPGTPGRETGDEG